MIPVFYQTINAAEGIQSDSEALDLSDDPHLSISTLNRGHGLQGVRF